MTAFVLIPTAAKVAKKEGTDIRDHMLLQAPALWLHNANVVTLHADLFVSKQRLIFSHVGAPVLWGLWYILFAWILAFRERWVAYPFIDFSLHPSKSIAFHLGLTAVLAIFFLLGVQFDTTLHKAPTWIRIVAHAVLLRFVTKFSHSTTTTTTKSQQQQINGEGKNK